jgi:hypothetical protein
MLGNYLLIWKTFNSNLKNYIRIIVILVMVPHDMNWIGNPIMGPIFQNNYGYGFNIYWHLDLVPSNPDCN